MMWNPENINFGVFSMVASSIYVTSVTVLISTPIGVGAAIYVRICFKSKNY